jgi:hypothetical protein
MMMKSMRRKRMRLRVHHQEVALLLIAGSLSRQTCGCTKLPHVGREAGMTVAVHLGAGTQSWLH